LIECFARLSRRLGVCLYVCPLVPHCDCIKTLQTRITKSLPWDATKVRGPLERERERRVPF